MIVTSVAVESRQVTLRLAPVLAALEATAAGAAFALTPSTLIPEFPTTLGSASDPIDNDGTPPIARLATADFANAGPFPTADTS